MPKWNSWMSSPSTTLPHPPKRLRRKRSKRKLRSSTLPSLNGSRKILGSTKRTATRAAPSPSPLLGNFAAKAILPPAPPSTTRPAIWPMRSWSGSPAASLPRWRAPAGAEPARLATVRPTPTSPARPKKSATPTSPSLSVPPSATRPLPNGGQNMPNGSSLNRKRKDTRNGTQAPESGQRPGALVVPRWLHPDEQTSPEPRGPLHPWVHPVLVLRQARPHRPRASRRLHLRQGRRDLPHRERPWQRQRLLW